MEIILKQVGQNLIVQIEGETFTKKVEDKEERETIKSMVKDANSSDKKYKTLMPKIKKVLAAVVERKKEEAKKLEKAKKEKEKEIKEVKEKSTSKPKKTIDKTAELEERIKALEKELRDEKEKNNNREHKTGSDTRRREW